MSAARVRLSSRPDWQRVKARKFSAWEIHGTLFAGYVTRLDLLEVTSPLWVRSCGEEICVADEGYSWLQHFPKGTRYTLTSQWNEKGQLIQWYFDICEHHGVTSYGIPYWEDLYLDVIGSANNVFEIIDQDGLAAALEQKSISPEQYRMATREADNLLRLLNAGDVELLEIAQLHYRKLSTSIANLQNSA